MAATVTKEGNGWAKVVLSPAVDGNLEMLINYAQQVPRVRLIEEPEVLDIVKITLSDGETIELHYGIGVIIDGTQATSNTHLMQLLLTLFTT